MDAEKLRAARDKLTRVFRYLEALNQHRNPAKRQIREQPRSFWLRELSEHPSIQRYAEKDSPSSTTNGGASQISRGRLLQQIRCVHGRRSVRCPQ
jgi:hypothetical protein